MKKLGIVMIFFGLIGMIFTAKTFFTQQAIDDEQSYPSEHIKEITIMSNYANIEILPTDSDEITVKLKGYTNSNNRKVTEIVTLKENTGKLQIDAKKSWFLNISFFNFKLNEREDLILHVPKKHYEFIDIKNDVGKTVVKDITVDQLTVENSVANMNLENVQANIIDVENNVGNITLKNNDGKIYAENDVGNISVVTDEINNDMAFIANVGKISLTVPSIPDDTTFKANTSLGSVNIFGESGSYINNGAEFIVSMMTDIGNISVEEQ